MRRKLAKSQTLRWLSFTLLRIRSTTVRPPVRPTCCCSTRLRAIGDSPAPGCCVDCIRLVVRCVLGLSSTRIPACAALRSSTQLSRTTSPRSLWGADSRAAPPRLVAVPQPTAALPTLPMRQVCTQLLARSLPALRSLRRPQSSQSASSTHGQTSILRGCMQPSRRVL